MAGGCKGCDKVAKEGEGFCCGKGKIFGVELASKKLYTSLAGHKFDLENVKCPGCKAAAESNGRCDHCNVGASGGKFYHSSIAYALAKGAPVSAKKAAMCAGCKTAHADDGFCTGCGVGFVAGRMFKGKEIHGAALAAYKTIGKAVVTAKKCESCAVAMVTDGTCADCKVSFKNGKKEG